MTAVGADRMSLAAKKNQANKSQLKNELSRIEKEKENEIRMHNNEKQRFKTKYSKLDVYQNGSNESSSNVSIFVKNTVRRKIDLKIALNFILNLR